MRLLKTQRSNRNSTGAHCMFMVDNTIITCSLHMQLFAITRIMHVHISNGFNEISSFISPQGKYYMENFILIY